jgi:hypothetical protein
MIYPPLELQTVGLLVGAFLIVMSLFTVAWSDQMRIWLKRLPRSANAGFILLTVASVWAFLLIALIDLGEFTPLRPVLLMVIAAGYFLTLKYVEEFLAVRALGILLLLLAEPVLEAAFLRPEISRLLVVTLAYVWILVGLFWVGMPYLMRDQIAWLSRTSSRWRSGWMIGLIYGAAILISALTLYR